MRFNRILTLAVLLTAVPTVAQENLPKIGATGGVANLHKLYLNADSTDSRKLILKELKKYPDLTVIDSPDNAEYFIDYKLLRQQTGQTSLNVTIYTSEMTAYLLREKRKIVAWSRTETSDVRGRPNETNLIRHFLDALKKSRREKK